MLLAEAYQLVVRRTCVTTIFWPLETTWISLPQIWKHLQSGNTRKLSFRAVCLWRSTFQFRGFALSTITGKCCCVAVNSGMLDRMSESELGVIHPPTELWCSLLSSDPAYRCFQGSCRVSYRDLGMAVPRWGRCHYVTSGHRHCGLWWQYRPVSFSADWGKHWSQHPWFCCPSYCALRVWKINNYIINISINQW